MLGNLKFIYSYLRDYRVYALIVSDVVVGELGFIILREHNERSLNKSIVASV